MTRGEPGCPAPPCLENGDFLSWCRDNSNQVDQLRYVWHSRSVREWEDGFYDDSHMVAYDVNGFPLHCTKWYWGNARNMADISDHLEKIRRFIR